MKRVVVSALVAFVLGGCSGASVQVQVRTASKQPERQAWTEREDLLALRMRALTDALAKEGWSLQGAALEGFLPSGSRREFELKVPAGRCRTVVGMGAPGITDLDASLFTLDGTVLAQDSAADARPTLHICAGERERLVYYVLNSYQGAGAYLAAVFDGAPSDLAAIERLLGEGTTGAPGQGDAADGKDGREYVGMVRGLVRRGFETDGADVELALTAGDSLRLALDVELGRCYAMLARPGKGLRALSVVVLDEAGEVAVRGGGDRDAAGVQFCANTGGAYTVQVQSEAGAGAVTISRLSGPGHVVGGERAMWLGERSVPPAVKASDEVLRGHLSRAGYGSVRNAGQGRLRSGEAAERALKVPSGCALVAAVSPSDVTVALRLVDTRGARLSSVTGQHGAALLHVCGPARSLRAQLAARRGSGSYRLWVVPAGGARRSVTSLPEPLRAAALDVQRRLELSGWALDKVEPWRKVELARCVEGDGSCAQASYEVQPDRCLHVAPLPGDKQASVELSAPTRAVAKAIAEGATRCSHDGKVDALVRVTPADGDGVIYLMHFER